MATQAQTITIGLVEDQQPLHQQLAQQSEFNVLLCCRSITRLSTQLPHSAIPDVIVLNIGLPNKTQLEQIKSIKRHCRQTEILLLAHLPDSETLLRALCAGVTGYLLRNSDMKAVKSAIKEICCGGSPFSPVINRQILKHFNPPLPTAQQPKFTPREQQVLDALVAGLSYKQIAVQLSIGLETVRHHIKNIYSKMQVNSKAQAIAKVVGQASQYSAKLVDPS